MLGQQQGVGQYLDLLVSRIRTIISDGRINSIIDRADNLTLEQWLGDYIGSDEKSPHLAILDLSVVPTEIVHIITAVIARMVFEALQRYRRMYDTVLPTVLVMEEAHTFVRRYKDDVESGDVAPVCCQVFERIAREGRKFGLGLVLSSQRPSEISPTILSQCNTFLLHRITNDRDQELVHRLLPDSLHGLLRELPSLPAQHAILLGWASELPVLVKIDDLPKDQRPQSDDPDFWSVWTRSDDDGGIVERTVDWKAIAYEWQQGASREATD
jgi:DNA helicase HerA-like ATPase